LDTEQQETTGLELETPCLQAPGTDWRKKFQVLSSKLKIKRQRVSILSSSQPPPMLGTMGYALFFYFVNEQVNANLFKDWIYYWIYLFSDSRRELIKGILSKLNAGDGL